MKFGKIIIFCLWAAFILLFLAGCAGIGPGSVARDRLDYTVGISESWKNQMLLNIVKMRYGDAPVFLDVASITNQYEIAGNINLSAQWQTNPPFGTSQIVGAQGAYADRPTITYSPLTGEKFTRAMLVPIPPETIMSLIQSGYDVDMVLRTLVNSINRVRNRFVGTARTRRADPEFSVLLDKFERMQQADALGIRLKISDKEAFLTFFHENTNPDMEKDILEIKKILGLNTRPNEFRVVYGSAATNDQEIAILTRSFLEILRYLASTIGVPDQHVSEKRVKPTMKEKSAEEEIGKPLIRIQSSREKPIGAFVTVSYRDYWFRIDDGDLDSKQMFSFIMFIFSLTETGGKEAVPILTIPAR